MNPHMQSQSRWKQRFQNFEKAFEVFQRRIDEYRLDPTHESLQMALVQASARIIRLFSKPISVILTQQRWRQDPGLIRLL